MNATEIADCDRCRLLPQLRRAVELGDHAAELMLRARMADCTAPRRVCNEVPTVVMPR